MASRPSAPARSLLSALLPFACLAAAAAQAPPVLTRAELLSPRAASFAANFGTAVAATGERLVVSALRDTATGTPSGAAYLDQRVGTAWIQEARLAADDGPHPLSFGQTVAISGDTVVVGSPLDDDGGMNAGAAYVFALDDGRWKQQVKLVAGDAGVQDHFGASVAISGDTIAVCPENTGACSVYVRDGEAWDLQATLAVHRILPVPGVLVIGPTVAIDGDTVVVGQPDGMPSGSMSFGAARIYQRTGTAWSVVQDLVDRETPILDRFGASVAIRGDLLPVGADRGSGSTLDSGKVSLYRRAGHEWEPIAILAPVGLGMGDRFGNAATISGDAIVAGTPTHAAEGSNSGAAYSFGLAALDAP